MGLPAAPEFQVNHTYAAGVQATSQYAGTGFLALDQTIDASTGLPAVSRDSAGIQTTFEYDALGRVTWSKPDPGQGGWTQYIYAPANPTGAVRANVTVRRRDNGSKTATILGVNLVVFDYFGRVYQEQRRLPGGAYNKRETIYDGSGNKASVSELTSGAAQQPDLVPQLRPVRPPGDDPAAGRRRPQCDDGLRRRAAGRPHGEGRDRRRLRDRRRPPPRSTTARGGSSRSPSPRETPAPSSPPPTATTWGTASPRSPPPPSSPARER